MGGSGASLGRRRGSGGSGVSVSPTSTGGKLVDRGGGQVYGENDIGYAVSILDGGNEDINFFRYGSRQIYEVRKYTPDGTQDGQTTYIPTKAEAKRARLLI